ncbi:MAG: hypothetical protein K9N55_15260 [Phycisphaerae bacterium]|nr:hypothetical protein [Phycisphaerae bacterium]
MRLDVILNRQAMQAGAVDAASATSLWGMAGCDKGRLPPRDIGYPGYVGHETIPTRDALTGLRDAIAWRDV